MVETPATLAWKHVLSVLRLINQDVANAMGHTQQALALLDDHDQDLTQSDEAQKLRDILKTLDEAYRNVDTMTLGFLITEMENQAKSNLDV